MLHRIRQWLSKLGTSFAGSGSSPNGAEVQGERGTHGILGDAVPVSKSKKPYFSQRCTFGRSRPGDEVRVDLLVPAQGARYPIVDNNGDFVNYPGIENEFLLRPYCKGREIAPTILFRSEFTTTEDGRHLVIWQVQPDGQYWADEDGFGGENDVEICLYSYVNERGDFTAPFRIYRIGATDYYETDLEEEEKKAYEERQLKESERRESDESVNEIIRRKVETACDFFIQKASESTKQFYVCFDVPETDYEAMIRLVGREPEWSLYVDVKIRGTDRLFSHIYTKEKDPGMHSKAWVAEEMKKEEAREFIFDSIKELCRRIDQD